jgi:hypothetical protein
MNTYGLGAGVQTAHLAFVPIEKTGKCGVLQPSRTINRQAQLAFHLVGESTVRHRLKLMLHD